MDRDARRIGQAVQAEVVEGDAHFVCDRLVGDVDRQRGDPPIGRAVYRD